MQVLLHQVSKQLTHSSGLNGKSLSILLMKVFPVRALGTNMYLGPTDNNCYGEVIAWPSLTRSPLLFEIETSDIGLQICIVKPSIVLATYQFRRLQASTLRRSPWNG